jgi:NAD(P)-dependent dehydrogenase (short-subunit alcohol dehydrogenase family)
MAMLRVFKNKWINPPKAASGDYSGRVIIVTGATSGIGEEAAYKFSALGASKVILTARDFKKGELTKAKLEARLKGKGQLEVWELDMMSYDSINAFAKRANELDHLDIAVLNAGTRRTTFNISSHGWEEDLQVNAISTTLLALLLLPKLKASKQQTGKIPILEFVNSGLHQNAIVPGDVYDHQPNVLEHYNKKDQFKEGNQYKFSKVFLMYATRCMADCTSSADVIITSVCPGWVMSNLGRDHYFPGIFFVAFFFIFVFMRTPSQGADTVVNGTNQGESVHGRFCQHDQIQPIPPSLKGAWARNLGMKVYDNILGALEDGGQDVEKLLADADFHDMPLPPLQ